MNIYQEIWNADMNENGVRPVFPSERMDPSEGYVVVDTQSYHIDHKVLKEVHIPNRKRGSYQLVEKLFDNYTLNQTSKEKNSICESKEVQEFLDFAIHSSPLKLAKRYIEEKANKVFNDNQWCSYLHDLWFRQFNWESGRDLSGFEHVFIGDQKGRKLVGHHFWYKYWLEDNVESNELHEDQISLRSFSQHIQKPPTPDVVTVSYHLKAYNYEKRQFTKVTKRKCAFFVGLSAEGLIALGTARAILEDQSIDVILNKVNYKLEMYMSPDGKSIRTFYPVFDPD